jgi:hypothetical protein
VETCISVGAIPELILYGGSSDTVTVSVGRDEAGNLSSRSSNTHILRYARNFQSSGAEAFS